MCEVAVAEHIALVHCWALLQYQYWKWLLSIAGMIGQHVTNHVCDILIDQNVTNHVCDILIDQPKRGLAPRWRVLELFCNVLPVRLARGELA